MRPHNERGSVTVELALAMVTVSAMLALIAALAHVGQVAVGADAAAAQAARLAARGESIGEVNRMVAKAAGAGARCSVSGGDLVTARVEVPVTWPIFGRPVALTVTGEAVAAREPRT